MLFMQCVTKHTHKINKSADFKVICLNTKCYDMPWFKFQFQMLIGICDSAVGWKGKAGFELGNGSRE